MRVIAGTAKGTKLLAPHGIDIRPTLDRVRTSLFDIIHNRIVGAVFLDLFAGTGANGIEALSRGAERAYFVEHSRKNNHISKQI
jgi:16S rRNA (guanine966-N2)-methyltransferase